VNDGTKRCPHGRTATTVAAPDHGPGWLRDLAPDTCSLCKAGQVLSTYRPGSVQAEPEELEAQGVEAQGEELTAAPEELEAADPPTGVLELLADRVEALELATAKLEHYEKMTAGRAETVEALEAQGVKLDDLGHGLARLAKLKAGANALDILGERVAKLEGLEELATAIADGVAVLEGVEENAARIDAVAKRVGALRGDVPALAILVRSLTARVQKLEAQAVEVGEAGPRAWFPGEHRRRVVVESPYAGDVEGNTAYARKAMADSLARGEAPLLSHLLYTQVLDDLEPEDRAAGMEAGWAWTPVADACVVYCDRGVSKGMMRGVDRAKAAGVRVERRWLSPMRDEYPATFDELEAADGQADALERACGFDILKEQGDTEEEA